MKKVALYGVFNPAAIAMFHEKLPKDFELIEFDSADELEKLRDADYLVNRSYPINEDVLKFTPKLKLLQKWGAGYDKIDLESTGKRGISVAICLGGNATPVAEHTVLLMLAVYRNLIPLSTKIKQNIWARDEYAKKSYMINGKTVGLLGLGSIGQKVGLIVRKGFGAEVQYYDLRRLPEEKEIALGFKFVDFETLLRTSDIISIHVPLVDTTRNMVNQDSFRKMKRSAVLINTSRGGVIDESALLEALQNKTIAGAGVDTFANEPLDADSPLLQFENLVATPHCGGNTADNDINMVTCCIENILKYDQDQELLPPALVNQAYLKR